MLHLFIPDIPVMEKIFRSVVVYLFMLLAFRVSGKRQVGQLTPFDLVLLLIISNVVQNALIGNDTSLGGGLLGAVTIFVLNFLVAKIVYRSKKVRHFLEPKPTLLIHNGKILEHNLEQEMITHEDLNAALRLHGLQHLGQVRFAILEENGEISIISNSTPGA